MSNRWKQLRGPRERCESDDDDDKEEEEMRALTGCSEDKEVVRFMNRRSKAKRGQPARRSDA